MSQKSVSPDNGNRWGYIRPVEWRVYAVGFVDVNVRRKAWHQVAELGRVIGANGAELLRVRIRVGIGDKPKRPCLQLLRSNYLASALLQPPEAATLIKPICEASSDAKHWN